jgi:hypothetical protein
MMVQAVLVVLEMPQQLLERLYFMLAEVAEVAEALLQAFLLLAVLLVLVGALVAHLT